MKLQYFILGICLSIAMAMVGLVYFEANLILSHRFQEVEESYAKSVRESVENALRVKSQELKLASERVNQNGIARSFLLRTEPNGATNFQKEMDSIKSATGSEFIRVIPLNAKAKSADGFSLDSRAVLAARGGHSFYAVSDGSAPRYLALYFPVKLFHEVVGVGVAGLSLQEAIAKPVNRSSGAVIDFGAVGNGKLETIQVQLGDQTITIGLKVSSKFAAENSHATTKMVWWAAGYLLMLMAGLYWALQFLMVRAFNANKSALTALRDSLRQGRVELQKGRSFPIQEMTDLSISVADVSQSIQGFQQKIETKTRTEAVGEKTAQIAHDLKGPIAALSAALDLEMIQEFSASKKEAIRFLLNRMRSIASAVSKESVDLRTPAPTLEEPRQSEPEDICVVVDEIVAEKTVQYSNREGLSILVASAPETSAWARVPHEFQRVLSNLIDNAAESIVGRGAITVSTAKVHDTILVSVSDTGIGIPESELGKIGERGVSIGKPDGSGLGLWHAKETIEGLGGVLRINSEVGIGTEVSITLPACAAAPWFVPAIEISDADEVVILDDDDWVHSMWAERIKATFPTRKRPKFRHCRSAQEFIEAAAAMQKRHRTAVFLCDQNLQMGGLTGLEVVKELSIAPTTILVTGNYHDHSIRKQCTEQGIRLLSKGQISSVPILFKNQVKSGSRSKRRLS